MFKQLQFIKHILSQNYRYYHINRRIYDINLYCFPLFYIYKDQQETLRQHLQRNFHQTRSGPIYKFVSTYPRQS